MIARAASDGAEAVELRLDSGRPDPASLLAAVRRAGLKAIACCRRASEGGGWSAGEEEREALLARALAEGADWIDLESASPLPARLRSRGEGRILLSHHDLAATPDDLAGIAVKLAESAARCGAIAAKLVPFARTLADNAAVRDLSVECALPFVRFAAGKKGLPSRLLARAWGSSSVYFAADPARPAVTGQIGVREGLEIYGGGRTDPLEPLYGIAGSPLDHSLSPRLHSAALRACGFPGRYLPFETADADELLDAAERLGIAGLSVTMPLKESMATRLADLSSEARAAGAVNTLHRETGAGPFSGANTDGAGALAAVGTRMDPGDARVLVLGTGGAARAVIVAFRRAGAMVWVHGRDAARTAAVAARTGANLCTPGQLAEGGWDLLLNATSAGMLDPSELPLPASAISARLVHDVVYRRDEPTRFTREAASRGIPVVEGIELLIEQAVLQFGLWHPHDEALPVTARRAMREALGLADRPGGGSRNPL